MKDLLQCPLCPGYRLNLSGPHSPHWVRSPAGVPELRDCKLRLVAENENAPSAETDEAPQPTSTLLR